MTDRLAQQLQRVNDILSLSTETLPQRLYDLSEANNYLLYLLEKADDLDLKILGKLQDDLSSALLAAVEQDPPLRHDETWGNTTALLDWLANRNGRPWRAPAPSALSLLTEAVACFTKHPDWTQRLAEIDAHPILKDYLQVEILFRDLEEDTSPDVRALMLTLKDTFQAPKKLPQDHWWTTQAPDWVSDWFQVNGPE